MKSLLSIKTWKQKDVPANTFKPDNDQNLPIRIEYNMSYGATVGASAAYINLIKLKT